MSISSLAGYLNLQDAIYKIPVSSNLVSGTPATFKFNCYGLPNASVPGRITSPGSGSPGSPTWPGACFPELAGTPSLQPFSLYSYGNRAIQCSIYNDYPATTATTAGYAPTQSCITLATVRSCDIKPFGQKPIAASYYNNSTTTTGAIYVASVYTPAYSYYGYVCYFCCYYLYKEYYHFLSRMSESHYYCTF